MVGSAVPLDGLKSSAGRGPRQSIRILTVIEATSVVLSTRQHAEVLSEKQS